MASDHPGAFRGTHTTRSIAAIACSSVPRPTPVSEPEGEPSLLKACLGELIGTYLLVLFGTGSVASAVMTGALVGLWQVAVVWGLGVAIAIYVAAPLSGAHLNPAVSLAFAFWRPRDFPWRRFPPYAIAQLVGAVSAGMTVAVAFGPFISQFEARQGIVRGTPGSELSAMVFGEYFPNPALFGTDATARSLVSPMHAAGVEAFGTALLVFVVFALTGPRARNVPPSLVPPLIGATVALLISLFAPITQASWNPARDFGPRLVAFTLGWGSVAIPGPESGFWIYILGPLAGGPIGGLVSRSLDQYSSKDEPSLRSGEAADATTF